MRKPKESDLVRTCLQWLTLHGIFCWRSSNHAVRRVAKGREFYAFHGLRGVSDVLAVAPGGRLICIEVKARSGKLRPDQALFLDEVNRRGGVGLVVRSLADLEAGLRAEGVTL